MPPPADPRGGAPPFLATKRHPTDTIPVARFGPSSDPAEVKAAVDAARARPFSFNSSNPSARLAFTTPLTEPVDGVMVDVPGVPPPGSVNGRGVALANTLLVARRLKLAGDAQKKRGDDQQEHHHVHDDRPSVRFSAMLDPTARTTACFDDSMGNFVGPTTGRRTDATGRDTRTSYALLAGSFAPPSVRNPNEDRSSDSDDVDAIEHPRDAGFCSPLGATAHPLIDASSLTPLPHSESTPASARHGYPGADSDQPSQHPGRAVLPFSTVLDITPGGMTASTNGRLSDNSSLSTSPGDDGGGDDRHQAQPPTPQPQTAAGFLALARAQAARTYQLRVTTQMAAAKEEQARRACDGAEEAPTPATAGKGIAPAPRHPSSNDEQQQSSETVALNLREQQLIAKLHSLADATVAKKSERREDADGFALPPQRVPHQPQAVPLAGPCVVPEDHGVEGQQPRFTAARLSMLDGAGDFAVPRDTVSRVTRELRFTAAHFAADPLATMTSAATGGRATASQQRPSIAARLTSVANTNAPTRDPAHVPFGSKINATGGSSVFDLSANKSAALAIDVLHKTWLDADQANAQHAHEVVRAVAVESSTPGPLSPGDTVLTLDAINKGSMTGTDRRSGAAGPPVRLAIESYVQRSDGAFTATLHVPSRDTTSASMEEPSNALGLKLDAGAACGCVLLTGKRGADDRLVARAAALVRGAAFLGRAVAVVRIEPTAAGLLGRSILLVTSAGPLRTLPAVAATALKLQPPEAPEIRVEVATLLLRLASQIAGAKVAVGCFDPDIVFVGFEREDGAPFAIAVPPLEYVVSVACFASSRGLALRWPAIATAAVAAPWVTPTVVERLAHVGVTPTSVIRDALSLIFAAAAPSESLPADSAPDAAAPAPTNPVAPFPAKHKASKELEALDAKPDALLVMALSEALMKLPSALPLLSVVAEGEA